MVSCEEVRPVLFGFPMEGGLVGLGLVRVVRVVVSGIPVVGGLAGMLLLGSGWRSGCTTAIPLN